MTAVIPSTAYLRADRWRIVGGAVGLTQGLASRAQVGAANKPIWQADFSYRVPTLGTSAAVFDWAAWSRRRRGPARAATISPSSSLRNVTNGVDWSYIERHTLAGEQRITENGDIRVLDVTPVLTTAAAEGATRIAVTDGASVTRGKFVWLADNMYRVVRVDLPFWDIEPPLRNSVLAGTAIAASGTVSMILEDETAAMAARDRSGYADVSFTMMEAI